MAQPQGLPGPTLAPMPRKQVKRSGPRAGLGTCLDVTCGPHCPHSVQILVAAGEHHAHGVMAFANL